MVGVRWDAGVGWLRMRSGVGACPVTPHVTQHRAGDDGLERSAAERRPGVSRVLGDVVTWSVSHYGKGTYLQFDCVELPIEFHGIHK